MEMTKMNPMHLKIFAEFMFSFELTEPIRTQTMSFLTIDEYQIISI